MPAYSRELQMKCLLTALLLTLTCGLGVCIAQSVQCPAGLVCISQGAANKAAENARELEATKAKVTILETALTDKDKLIADVQKTARENEADLKAQNVKLLTDVAEKTGQIIKCDAFAVRDAAIIEFLVKNQRSKQNGLINIKLGGN